LGANIGENHGENEEEMAHNEALAAPAQNTILEASPLADTELASDQAPHQMESASGQGQRQSPSRRSASDRILGIVLGRDTVQSFGAITDGHTSRAHGLRVLSWANTAVKGHASRSDGMNESHSVESGSSAPLTVEPSRVTTRSRHGISKPKVYTDGTIRYSFLASVGEPATVQEALNDCRWREVMNMEFEALQANSTWHLVPSRKGINIIDCKWVYKISTIGNRDSFIGLNQQI
jgi:hypothetical protein